MPATLPFLSFPFNSILLFHFLLSQEYTTAQELGVASLLGPPKIKCEESSILVSLLTSEPFEGNGRQAFVVQRRISCLVYAKGFFDNDNCKVKGDSSGNTVNITIPLSTICGMRRRRIVSDGYRRVDAKPYFLLFFKGVVVFVDDINRFDQCFQQSI